MTITHKTSGEQFRVEELPIYVKHNVGGSHYGWLILTRDLRVFIFYAIEDGVECEDVTHQFNIEL